MINTIIYIDDVGLLSSTILALIQFFYVVIFYMIVIIIMTMDEPTQLMCGSRIAVLVLPRKIYS